MMSSTAANHRSRPLPPKSREPLMAITTAIKAMIAAIDLGQDTAGRCRLDVRAKLLREAGAS